MVELRRRQLGEQPRKLDRRRMGALEEAVVERQLAHLARRGVGQFVAAVADVDAPEPRHAVQDLVAVGVVDVHALGAGDDPRALCRERLEVGERMQVVTGIELLPVAGRSFRNAWFRAHGISQVRRSAAGAPVPTS